MASRPRDEMRRALAPVAPSTVARPASYYERQRRMERATAPLFALVVFVVVPLAVWLLTEL